MAENTVSDRRPGRRVELAVPSRVLVLEDEETVCEVLRTHLRRRGCEVRCADSAEAASELVRRWEPDAALVDVILPGRSGLQFVTELKQVHPNTEVVMMTSNASADTALQALRRGAGDFLEKPFALDDLWTTLQRALEKRKLELRNRELVRHEERLRHELTTSVAAGERTKATGETNLLDDVLHDFLQVITRELDVERASLMLLDEQTGELEVAASQGLQDVDPNNIRVPVGRGISGFVFETGEPFLVTDARADGRLPRPTYPELAESFLSAPIALSVPIESQRQVLGVVNVTNRRSGEPLGSRDVAYLCELAAQLATAIEGARRAEQLQRAYRHLQSTRQQLVFSERIQTVGQMAAGVAHDFNNALSIILARAQFMQDKLNQAEPDLDRVRGDLQTVIHTALHAGQMIKRIQDYTRIREQATPTPVEINSVVRTAVEMSRPKWKEQTEVEGRSVDVVLDLASVPAVGGNVFELTQVVNNLIFNAVDAMPDGGRLGFRTFVDGDSVVLEVSDTGIGMDEQTRERLFEPFFTTKPQGQGLGAGIVYSIVTRHGGRVQVDSEPGQGTTFTVRLPAVERLPEVDAVGDETPVAAAAGVRVLLVDDDVQVRETYEEALRTGGHDVVSARTASEALELCRAGDFDVVITDLSMGQMSGLDLASAIKQEQADLPILLFSGWALQHDEQSIRESGIDYVLAKPCLIEDLLAAVQRAARS